MDGGPEKYLQSKNEDCSSQSLGSGLNMGISCIVDCLWPIVRIYSNHNLPTEKLKKKKTLPCRDYKIQSQYSAFPVRPCFNFIHSNIPIAHEGHRAIISASRVNSSNTKNRS